jgi:hypothetical protein
MAGTQLVAQMSQFRQGPGLGFRTFGWEHGSAWELDHSIGSALVTAAFITHNSIKLDMNTGRISMNGKNNDLHSIRQFFEYFWMDYSRFLPILTS